MPSAHLIVKTEKLIINVIFGPNNWFCKARNMRIDASRWNVLKANVMRVQQQTNSVDCGILAMAFLILFDEDPKTQRFEEKLLQESLLQMLAEQRVRCFPTTENNVVKCKSKSISLDLYCSCCQPCFSKDAIVENKQMAKCRSSRKWFYRMCERCLKRSLRMAVLNGIAWVVHFSKKIFSFRTDSVES